MAEFITAEQRTELVKLYIAYFNRAPETDGLDFHARAFLADINAGLTAEQAFHNRADAFFEAALIQSEFTGYSAGQTVEEFIAKVYSNVLLRPGDGGNAPTDAEIGYWVNELAVGNVTPGGLVVAFLDAQQVLIDHGTAEEVEGATKVKEIIEARIKVALEFAKPEISGELRGADAHDAGVAALAGVVDDATANARITELEDLANAGETYTLTSSADTFDGTADYDVFNALPITADGSPGSTFTAFDKIDGGAGRDTLNIYTTATENTGFPANASVKNVEIVNIYNTDPANPAALGDASRFEGVVELWQHDAAGAVTNLGAGTTAGFNGIANGTLSVTAADAAASATVALKDVDDATTLTVDSGINGSLSKVSVLGSVVDAAADGVDPIALDVTVGKDVETLEIDTAVAVNLAVNNNGKNVSTVNASASTGAIIYGPSPAVANISTGEGNDYVTLNFVGTATANTATLSTGAGNDTLKIDVTKGAASSVTATVDAGEGDDTIDLTINPDVVYDVTAGAGDDIVTITGTVKTTDKIDGGDGNDTVSFVSKGAYVADDYIVFNKLLTNFETLQLTGAAVTDLDAGQLAANYTTIDLSDGSKVTGVGSQTLIANGKLTATAAGSDGNNDVYAGELNIVSKATGLVTADAESVKLTVDASAGPATVNLAGFVKSADVTLVQALKADNSGYEGAAQLSFNTLGTLGGLTSLTLSGNGEAFVVNNDTSLVTIDASALGSVTFDGKADLGLTYATDNTNAETIILGDGIDTISILSGSTFAAHDTITGLNLIVAGGVQALESDKLNVALITGAVEFTTAHTDLELALKDAAALTDDSLVFHFDGDTYIYGDVGGNDELNDSDILVKLTGTVDLDALIVALG